MELSLAILGFINHLPDPAGAQGFLSRLIEEQPERSRTWLKDERFLSNLLTLAAYSPWLAETMLQHPDYVDWLKRERDLQSVKSKETLLEELARFAARQFELEPAVALARFKRRELLRIYLRDCLRLATLSETIEELSNLADSLLQHALDTCMQKLTKRYGLPLVKDARGRSATAEFGIFGLGKLGSRELNYASDIDIMFLYSAEGATAGDRVSPASVISNREFFVKLAESIVNLVGQAGSEGAVYRIDLRLRPHGRTGSLAHSLLESVRYYTEIAQPWERQSLIKARVAAGSDSLGAQFMSEIAPRVFQADPPADVLKPVRFAKDKIDAEQNKRTRPIGSAGRYNVKLGSGGIREIEFIVQGLQLAHAGRDSWLRAPQTLIGLRRLADKGLLTEREYTALSTAYDFLRLTEHRLQMEQGVQTHTLPAGDKALALLARRLGFVPRIHSGDDQKADEAAKVELMAALDQHRQEVSTCFARIFGASESDSMKPTGTPSITSHRETVGIRLEPAAQLVETDRLLADTIGDLTAAGLHYASGEHWRRGLNLTRNPTRALKNLRAFANSLLTYFSQRCLVLTPAQIEQLVIILGSGQFFAQMLINNPTLAADLPTHSILLPELSFQTMPGQVERYRLILTGSELTPSLTLEGDIAERAEPNGLSAAMTTSRRQWQIEILKIACADLVGGSPLWNVNRAQSALALATLEQAVAIARQSLNTRGLSPPANASFAVLGLGRIAHWGMDYGSDVDLLFVYQVDGADETGLEAQSYYGELAELIVHILSTMTREGYLYQVDLRLRPNGSKGLLAQSAGSMIDYVKNQAAAWEHLAYLRVRHVAGDASFGSALQDRIVSACLQRPEDVNALASSVRDMRERLIKQHAGRASELNVRWGRGAMMDVYFLTRFLQLKHKIANAAEPGTLPLIQYLNTLGVISDSDRQDLYDGYDLLRRVEHQLRLLFDRPTRVLPHNQGLLQEMALALRIETPNQFLQVYESAVKRIAELFEELVR